MRLTFAVLLTSAAIATPAQGTPGGLNKAGCHNSKKAGYHCHRAQQPTAPAKAAKPPPAKKETRQK